jgi:hypothetical protein
MMSPTFIKGGAVGAAEDMAAVFFLLIRNENGNWIMSLKIGNKSKLVYDWSFSVLGRCDCVVQLVLDLVFFGLAVLCSCFCVDRQIDQANRSGKWMWQIDQADGSGKSIRQMDVANRPIELPPNRIAK